MFGSRRNKVAFTILLLIFSVRGISQRITNLSLSTSGGVVRVDFEIIKGTNCFGYRIFHSVDSSYFNLIEDYPGLCSSTQENLSYNFTHQDPARNQMNYYKVELPNVETSPIQKIFVPANDRPSLRAYPNPMLLGETNLRLKASNTENGQLEGFLCEESGHVLEKLLVDCFDYTIDLPISIQLPGIYFIWLSDGRFVYGSKIIVLP